MYIVLGIVLLFALILSFNVTVSYTVDNKDVSVFLRVGPVKIRLFPSKKKKFNYKKLAKRLRHRKISEITFSKKEKEKQDNKKGLDIKEILTDLRLDNVINEISKSTKNPELTRILLSTVKEFAIQFRKKLKVKIFYAHIGVDAGEAGDTCIRVGVFSQAVAYLLEFLSIFTGLSQLDEKAVSVTPVFDGSGNSFKVSGYFKVRIAGALSSLISSLFKSVLKEGQNNVSDTTRKEPKK